MSISAILAANLRALMDVRAGLNTVNAIAQRSGAPKTNVHRMVHDLSAAQINTVEQVARAFRLRACDLLDPSLSDRVTTDAALRVTEARPPIVDAATWAQLSPTVRALVEDIVSHAQAGLLTDERAAWLQQSMRMSTPPRPADQPPKLTPEGEAAFESLAREAEQHHAEQQHPGGRQRRTAAR